MAGNIPYPKGFKKEDVIGPSDTKNPEGKTSEELRMTALAEGWEGI